MNDIAASRINQVQHDSAQPNKYTWIAYSLLTVALWGVWGAIIYLPEQRGFPAELGFIMWALSMLVPAAFCLRKLNWRIELDPSAVFYGSTIGLLGCAGQLILYSGAITNGPAYLIFPVIALSPVVTILMSLLFLGEKASAKGYTGIALALVAMPFLNYSDPVSTQAPNAWILFALLVFLAWGVQGFFLKSANRSMKAESIFFYMAITSVCVSPVAWLMLDTPTQANWGWDGAGLAFGIGLLNSLGALFLVYAFRYGKAIVVSPLVNCLPPIITSILSLVIMSTLPSSYAGFGMIIALISAYLLTLDEA